MAYVFHQLNIVACRPVLSHPLSMVVYRYDTGLSTLQPISYPFDATNITHLPVFQTDSNGALMMQRVTNRTQWEMTPVHLSTFFHLVSAISPSCDFSGVPILCQLY